MIKFIFTICPLIVPFFGSTNRSSMILLHGPQLEWEFRIKEVAGQQNSAV